MSKHTRTSSFDPAEYISDKPLTSQERDTLNKILDRTKIELFYMKHGAGFLGSLIAMMDFVWDRSIPTACTNGVFMAWNPEFFLDLDKETRVSVLAHEAWHVAFQHMDRRETRDPEIYNRAADHVINNHLEDHGYYMGGFPYLMDPKYKGMNTEEVYKDLYDNQPPGGYNPNPQNGDFASGSSGPDSIKGGMTPSQIQTAAKGNIIDAHTTAKMNKAVGDLPGEVKAMLDEFLEPKVSWREIFFNFWSALSEPARSLARANRRYTDPIMPGKAKSTGLEHIIYFLDVSGSISDPEIVQFNSEVKHIKDTFNPELLTLVQFDTKIQSVTELEADDEFEEIEIIGRGGTHLGEVYKYIDERMPSAVVIFSDLYVHIPSEPPKVPIIWCCTGQPDAKVPYGTLIHMELDEDE